MRSSLIRVLTVGVSLAAAIALAGATLAASPPRSTHASSTAVTQVAANASENSDESPSQNEHDSAVATAANSDIVGGAHQNHGGYVSCVARGGSECTSTTPTLPSHGSAPTLPTQAHTPDVPTR